MHLGCNDDCSYAIFCFFWQAYGFGEKETSDGRLLLHLVPDWMLWLHLDPFLMSATGRGFPRLLSLSWTSFSQNNQPQSVNLKRRHTFSFFWHSTGRHFFSSVAGMKDQAPKQVLSSSKQLEVSNAPLQCGCALCITSSLVKPSQVAVDILDFKKNLEHAPWWCALSNVPVFPWCLKDA